MTQRYSTAHGISWGDYHAEGQEDGTIHLWKENQHGARTGRDATISRGEVEALSLVFKDQRDIDLGRWRSETRRHMVVYPDPQDDKWVTVLNENTGESQRMFHKGNNDLTNDFQYAAEFYFRQHRPRGKWTLAEHNEVWLLNFDDGSQGAFTMDRREPETHPDGVFRNLETYLSGASESIRFGKKLFPKENQK